MFALGFWPLLGLVGKQKQVRFSPCQPLQGAEGFTGDSRRRCMLVWRCRKCANVSICRFRFYQYLWNWSTFFWRSVVAPLGVASLVRSLPMKSTKGLADDVMDSCEAHAGLVRDVWRQGMPGTNCQCSWLCLCKGSDSESGNVNKVLSVSIMLTQMMLGLWGR